MSYKARSLFILLYITVLTVIQLAFFALVVFVFKECFLFLFHIFDGSILHKNKFIPISTFFSFFLACSYLLRVCYVLISNLQEDLMGRRRRSYLWNNELGENALAIKSKFEELTKKHYRAIKLFHSTDIEIFFTRERTQPGTASLPFFGSMIILPISYLIVCNEDEIESILAHEFSHIFFGSYLINQVRLAIFLFLTSMLLNLCSLILFVSHFYIFILLFSSFLFLYTHRRGYIINTVKTLSFLLCNSFSNLEELKMDAYGSLVSSCKLSSTLCKSERIKTSGIEVLVLETREKESLWWQLYAFFTSTHPTIDFRIKVLTFLEGKST